jgi:anti-sigma factor RsiW
MSSTVNSEAQAHRQARQLLPWLLAGTLEGAELAMVQEHLETCERCRADLAWDRKLRAAGQQCEPAPDPDRALAQLLPRLGQQDRAGRVPARWRSALAANDNRWLRSIAAAQFGVIAVLALLLARPGAQEASYRGLGAGERAQGNLVVMFRPDTTEAELRRILRAHQARVVDGPTTLDAYVLAVPAARTASTAERLAAEPAVTLAQPLTSENGP